MLGFRIIWALAAPIAALSLAMRLFSGRESLPDIRDRLALGSTGTSGGVIWVHGASVGEMAAARPLVEALSARYPDRAIHATAHTKTGVESIKSWKINNLSVGFAPFDFLGAPKRFFKKWQPEVYIALESELWPERIRQAGRDHVPIFQVAARMSEKSFVSWQKRLGLAAKTFGSIGFLAAVDDTSRDRFRALGTPQNAIGQNLNLKALVAPAQPAEDDVRSIAAAFAHEETILAASTHRGEDDIVLTAFQQNMGRHGVQKLIIAPRHIERGDDIAKLVEDRGLALKRRSTGALPDPDTDVYLFDTMGEMPVAYACAHSTIIGGTFVDMGGHTPVEPVHFGSLVIHGPSVANQQAAFDKLADFNASIAVKGGRELPDVLSNLPDDTRRRNMVDLATKAMQELASDGADLGEVLEQLEGIISSKTVSI